MCYSVINALLFEDTDLSLLPAKRPEGGMFNLGIPTWKSQGDLQEQAGSGLEKIGEVHGNFRGQSKDDPNRGICKIRVMRKQGSP
jgi:hypothetical protein